MTPNRDQICQWMFQAASGNDAAFGCLAGAVQDTLYSFVLAHGLRRDDAAEATQETLLRAYRMRGQWRQGGDAMTWLYGIAMNVVREFRRKARKTAVQGLDLNGICAGRQLGQEKAGPLSLQDLQAAIERLPARQQEALVCRYLRRMSVRETAAVMGCAEGTVKAAVAAALQNLRRGTVLRHLQEE